MALSDFFSAWKFHVALINGLPVVKAGGLPLSYLSFAIIGILFVYLLLRHKFQINDVQRKLTVSLLLFFSGCFRQKQNMMLIPISEGADYFNQKTEYYLYPLRIDQNGKYIAVFHTGQRTAFDEKKGTFAYKGFDGREVILPSVKRLAVYKENEELYRITQ